MTTALYARVSTQEQAAHGNSIDEQNDRMKSFCASFGWTGIKTYVDAGFSGAKMTRPALQELIEDIYDKKVDRVLVYKLDRLSRSQKDTLSLIEDVFLKNNVAFISMCENFDTSSPFGRAMIGILAVFAQLEREHIKERMAMGKEALVKKGVFMCSRKPFGYDRVGRDLIPNEDAEIVRMVFSDYLSGKSAQAIAIRLRNLGYDKAWESTVKLMLSRRTYLGEVCFRGKWYKGNHEPIVDQSVFDAVQAKKAHVTYYNKKPGKATSYLSGYLFCGECGHKYVKTHWAHSPYMYCCSARTHRNKLVTKDMHCTGKHWKMEALDKIVLGEMRKLQLDPSLIEKPREKVKSKLADELKKTNIAISRLVALYGDGKIPEDALEERIDELSLKKKDLEIRLKVEKEEALSRKEATIIVSSIGDILDRGDFNEIRSLIDSLIKKIVVNGEDIEIYWNFS